MFSTYIRPGEHDFGAFSPEFSRPGSGTGSGGQISKVILISKIVYQIVQFDELSRMVQTFFESDLPIASYD